MSTYIGDIVTGATARGTFNTRTAAGAPVTLAGTPLIRVYKDDGTTEDDSGITLNVDFDSRTGLHVWEVDTSADTTFYAAAADYHVVLTAGTADSVSVVGVCVGHFSIENRKTQWIRKGTAQAGAASTITLDAGASASDDFYNNTLVQVLSGTGAGQSRVISDYVGATKVATVAASWGTNPGADSVFVIYPGGAVDSSLSAAAVDAILDDQLADSIPADGTLPTVRQALYMLTQFMLERSVSGTTVTVKKADGSTALFTLTLNDATTPTSITRAS